MSEVNLEEWVLVDTDVFSFLMSDTSKYKNLYLPHVNGKRVAVAFITVGELYFGAKRKNWGENRIADLKHRLGKVTIVPFDDGVCKVYADIKARMEEKGERIEDNDTWIAACAIRHKIVLVSNNGKHFGKVPGLILKCEAAAMTEMQSQMKIGEDQEASTPSPTAPPPPSSR